MSLPNSRPKMIMDLQNCSDRIHFDTHISQTSCINSPHSISIDSFNSGLNVWLPSVDTLVYKINNLQMKCDESIQEALIWTMLATWVQFNVQSVSHKLVELSIWLIYSFVRVFSMHLSILHASHSTWSRSNVVTLKRNEVKPNPNIDTQPNNNASVNRVGVTNAHSNTHIVSK